jgi:uncharacterized protein (DUF1800 family)
MAQLPDLTPGAGASSAPEAERRRVARLFQRAGFGASVDEIDQWAARGYAAAVDHLLAFPPAAGRPDNAEVAALVAGAPSAAEVDFVDMGAFQRWWLDRMATTAHPLEEKLTLYWHGHFATAFSKVKRHKLMLAQNQLLRDFAGGNFRELANKVTADAAMLIWLDGNTNQRAAPNENYGREFMELFTLGRDRYTQEDVRQAARAFTGYVTDEQGNVAFNPELHDPGEKVILGNVGPWAPFDVTDIVLDRHPEGPVAAHYVAGRLARFLYRPDPEPAVVQDMAAAFAGSKFEIKPMVRALLLRPEFIDSAALTIKSPTELVAGTIRGLDLARVPAPKAGSADFEGFDGFGFDDFVDSCGAMGQELFDPPNVAGWKGGTSWANTATTLARYNFAAKVGKLVTDDAVGAVLAAAGGEPRETAGPWMHRLGLLELLPTTSAAIDRYLSDSAGAGTDAGTRARGVLTLLLASPDYNLR